MILEPFSALACPLDQHPLHVADGAWRCANGHHFDIAREGYVHLLPVQNKRSRDPGDSKEMVAARRRFLAAGHYALVAQAVSNAILPDETLPGEAPGEGETLSCLDAGCGEGYYLRHLAAASAARETGVFAPQSRLRLLGLDISKWAIIAAAKQDQQEQKEHTIRKDQTSKEGQKVANTHPVSRTATRWVVGSNANLPVLSGSIDRILCLFGFPAYDEFARVLSSSGLLVQMDAGPDHLRELREVIYPSLKPARETNAPPAPFVQIDTQTVRYELDLPDQQTINDLLVMTPHLYRANAEGRERAGQLSALTVTIDVRLTVLQKVLQQTPQETLEAPAP